MNHIANVLYFALFSKYLIIFFARIYTFLSKQRVLIKKQALVRIFIIQKFQQTILIKTNKITSQNVKRILPQLNKDEFLEG